MVFFAFITFILFCFLTSVAMWFMAIIDILRSEFVMSQNKIIWLVIVFIFPIIGSILYYFIGTHQKIVTY